MILQAVTSENAWWQISEARTQYSHSHSAQRELICHICVDRSDMLLADVDHDCGCRLIVH
eukprot:SAG31_NODE_11105_length_1066_cov_0.880041_2_plen_59_part_01